MIRHTDNCRTAYASAAGEIEVNPDDPLYARYWHDTCTDGCYSKTSGKNRAGVLIDATADTPAWPGKITDYLRARIAAGDRLFINMPRQYGRSAVHDLLADIRDTEETSMTEPNQDTLPGGGQTYFHLHDVKPWTVMQTVTVSTLTQLVMPDGKLLETARDEHTHDSEIRVDSAIDARDMFRRITDVKVDLTITDEPSEPEHDHATTPDPLPWLIHITVEGQVFAIEGHQSKSISRQALDISHFEPALFWEHISVISATDSNHGTAWLPGLGDRELEWCRYANNVLTGWKMSR